MTPSTLKSLLAHSELQRDELQKLQRHLHENIVPCARDGIRPGADGNPETPAMAFAYGAMRGFLWMVEETLERCIGPYTPESLAPDAASIDPGEQKQE